MNLRFAIADLQLKNLKPMNLRLKSLKTDEFAICDCRFPIEKHQNP